MKIENKKEIKRKKTNTDNQHRENFFVFLDSWAQESKESWHKEHGKNINKNLKSSWTNEIQYNKSYNRNKNSEYNKYIIQFSKKLDTWHNHVKKDIEKESNIEHLYFLKSKYLGRNSDFTNAFKNFKNFNEELRFKFGNEMNKHKEKIINSIDEKVSILEKKELENKLKSSKIDITLPGIGQQLGHRNPLFLVIEEITTIFKNLGYQIISGTEVDNEEYNFNRLNLPENHPARAMQDTFYINDSHKGKNRLLLRTHCTNMTARILSSAPEELKEPLAYISLGNVYRKDDDDATHSHQFMQMDAFLAGHGVTFANLKWTLEYFCQKLFGADSKIRLRPSYFPFTEPSAEVDVSCPICGGRGCSLCKHTGWIEILGAGMIHPNVFQACGIKDANITGFAFGVGIERIAMIKYSIDDIRLFYNNDLRFLKQF